MSRATAGVEIPELALGAGFELKHETESSVGFLHRARMEGFALHIGEDGQEFVRASWHAPDEYVAIVDRRAPGEFGKEGRALAPNSKRRSVGMDDVRPELRTSMNGLDINYTELKKRIRNEGWRDS